MEEFECKRIVGMAVTETTSEGILKKRKLGSEDSEQCSSNYAEIENCPSRLLDSQEKSVFPASVGISYKIVDGDLTCSRSGSDHIPASRCSSNESSGLLVSDYLRSVDLKAKGFETDQNSTSINNNFSRETSPLSEICGESEDMDSSEKKSAASHRRRSPAVNIPSAAEIEEFFSRAEKYDQKRFAEKYNYDVVNDLPLEGRYEWIQLKP